MGCGSDLRYPQEEFQEHEKTGAENDNNRQIQRLQFWPARKTVPKRVQIVPNRAQTYPNRAECCPNRSQTCPNHPTILVGQAVVGSTPDPALTFGVPMSARPYWRVSALVPVV